MTEAERLLRGVLALDPLDTYTLEQLASTVYPAMGRFQESDRIYAKLRELDAGYTWINTTESIVATLQGNYPLAIQLAEDETDMEGKETGFAIVYAALGKPDKSKQALERLLRMPTVAEYNIAIVYAYRGEKDVAFRHLEAACQQREPLLLKLKSDPLLAGLRSGPRYKALLRRMNLPE